MTEAFLSIQQNLTACVGRTEELRRLTQVVDGLTDGRGQVVLIEGVAGIGKSFVISQLESIANSRGITTARGGSGPLDRDRPFGAICDAMGCTSRATDQARQTLWQQVNETSLAAPWEREGAIVRFAVQDAFVELLEVEASGGPYVLVIDDLHWADAASIAAIGVISRLCTRLPVLLVLSYRPVPQPPELTALISGLTPTAATMRLNPLSLGESAQLVAKLAADDGVRSLSVPVQSLGGNPFLLVSAAQAAQAHAGGSDHDGIVRWAVLGRLDGLATATMAMLRVAAALGGPFDPVDVAIVLRRPELDVIAGLDEAVRAGVVVPHGRQLMFVHDLVRETMLAELSEPLRFGLHHAIWQAMAAADRPAARYAGHVVMACGPGDREAIAALSRAGQELAETDPDRAAALLAVAAELATPLTWAERGDLAADQAEVLRLAGRPADVVAIVEECREWPVPAAQLARLEFIGAGSLRFLGRVPEATAMLRQAVSRHALPPATTSWAWSLIATGEVFSLSATPDAFVGVAEARRIAEECGDRAALVQSWCATSYVAWLSGRIDQALDAATTATELGAELGQVTWPAPALARALALLSAGDAIGARATITPWGRRAEQCGDLWALSRMEMASALACFESGDWDSALAHCDTIARVGIETGGANGQPLAQAISGLIACRRGDLPLARTRSTEGHRVLESPCVDPLGIPFLTMLDAELAGASGDPGAARAQVSGLFDFAVMISPLAVLWFGLGALHCAVDNDDDERLARLAALMIDSTVGSDFGRRVGEIAVAASRHDAFELERLAADPSVCLAPYRARTTWLMAATLHERAETQHHSTALHPPESADTARCREHALAIEQALGMSAAAPFSSLGSNRPASAARPTFGPGSLTPAEDSVLALVAEGLTNAAIAERLVLSKRTVESHVSRMYTKLGASTRVELARCRIGR